MTDQLTRRAPVIPAGATFHILETDAMEPTIRRGFGVPIRTLPPGSKGTSDGVYLFRYGSTYGVGRFMALPKNRVAVLFDNPARENLMLDRDDDYELLARVT